MIQIRRAQLKDLPTIVAIYNSTIPSGMVTADTKLMDISERIEWFYSFNDQRPLWVATHNREVCAWMSFKSFYGRPAYRGAVEIALYLAEDFRLKGLGQMLLLHAFREAEYLNIHTLLAFVFANNEPSIRFFRKYGFIDYGKLPAIAEINDHFQDLLIFGYKI